VHALVRFLIPDLVARTLLLTLTPVLVLSVSTLWIVDHNREQLAQSQAQQSVQLLAAHVIASLKTNQPPHTILPPSDSASLTVWDTSHPNDQTSPVAPQAQLDDAIRDWRLSFSQNNPNLGTSLLVHTATGPTLKTFLPIDRPALASDRDNPNAIIANNTVLDRLAILETSIEPITSAWSTFRQQLIIIALLTAFCVLLSTKIFTQQVLLNPLNELRCRLGDALGPEKNLNRSLKLPRLDELGMLSADIDLLRTTLCHDIRTAQDSLHELATHNSQINLSFSQQADHITELTDAADDAALQSDQLRHNAHSLTQHLESLNAQLPTLQKRAHQLDTLAIALRDSLPESHDHDDHNEPPLSPDASLGTLSSLGTQFESAAESLDVLATNIALAALKSQDQSTIQHFADQSRELQSSCRDNTQALLACLAQLSDHTPQPALPVYATEQTSQRLVSIADALAADATETQATLDSISHILANSDRALNIINARLNHINTISQDAADSSDTDTLTLESHNACLKKTLDTIDQYTVTQRAA
jgi:hypothetical protein